MYNVYDLQFFKRKSPYLATHSTNSEFCYSKPPIWLMPILTYQHQVIHNIKSKNKTKKKPIRHYKK